MSVIRRSGKIGETQVSATSVWIRVDPEDSWVAWEQVPSGARVEVVVDDTPGLLVWDLARMRDELKPETRAELPLGLRMLMERACLLAPTEEEDDD